MTNETEHALLHEFNLISEYFTKYIGAPLYIICLLGTLMNILTFLQQTYTSRACILYLLMASIFDFAHLNLDPLANILQYGFHSDWTVTNELACKAKSYFAYVFTVTSGTLTTSASITQYLLSSQKNSRWYYARRHIGIRCIKLVTVFWFVMSVPMVFCSERVYHVFRNELFICTNPSQYLPCYLVQLAYVCLFNGFLPPLIMLIFGFLTHRNVHHLHQRSRYKSVRIRRLNQQLTSMLILQSIKSTVASIPYSTFNCYWLITIRHHKSLVVQAKENFIHQMCYLLFWSNYTSFFVYMYSSDIFRDQWVKALKKVVCCLCGKRQRRNSLGRR